MKRSLRENSYLLLLVQKKAAALTLARCMFHEVLKKDLELHPFKFQLVQEIKEKQCRKVFVLYIVSY